MSVIRDCKETIFLSEQKFDVYFSCILESVKAECDCCHCQEGEEIKLERFKIFEIQDHDSSAVLGPATKIAKALERELKAKIFKGVICPKCLPLKFNTI